MNLLNANLTNYSSCEVLVLKVEINYRNILLCIYDGKIFRVVLAQPHTSGGKARLDLPR